MYSTLFHYDPIATAAAMASAINVENESICSAPIIPLLDNVVDQLTPIFNCDYGDKIPTLCSTLITNSNPHSLPIIDSNGGVFLTNQSSAISPIPQIHQHQNTPVSISSLINSSNCCCCLSSFPQSLSPSSSLYSLFSSSESNSPSIPMKLPTLSYSFLEKHSNKPVNDKDKYSRSNNHHRYRHLNMNIFNKKISLLPINHSEKRKNKIHNLSNNKNVNLSIENRKQMVNILNEINHFFILIFPIFSL